ncbi:DUF2529 domain-containing protein [Fictibacillus sp. WQ 8-8]|uniref:DUF2529 family protein n=1 Tax=Fictibacillus sp. WQ 8-8 TaxID=2938788 RepID=UPI00210CF5D6|nr:DUF2529 family protein [Fictibacillus sp. WQ 8-8]MCQ6264934.1 DUF2529 domain-containing protein [Fictibacillus sp. WQ 8-8]
MLKIFFTQLNGIFSKIQQDNEFAFEDAARLLAQTVLSHGTVYFTGKDEMEAVCAEGIHGQEAFSNAKPLNTKEISQLTSVDTVLASARFHDDEPVLSLLQEIKQNTDASIIFLASRKEKGEEAAPHCDAFIDLKVKKGLVPAENGERIGIPSAMAGLFAYHALFLTAKEILEEYED